MAHTGVQRTRGSCTHAPRDSLIPWRNRSGRLTSRLPHTHATPIATGAQAGQPSMGTIPIVTMAFSMVLRSTYFVKTSAGLLTPQIFCNWGRCERNLWMDSKTDLLLQFTRAFNLGELKGPPNHFFLISQLAYFWTHKGEYSNNSAEIFIKVT